MHHTLKRTATTEASARRGWALNRKSSAPTPRRSASPPVQPTPAPVHQRSYSPATLAAIELIGRKSIDIGPQGVIDSPSRKKATATRRSGTPSSVLTLKSGRGLPNSLKEAVGPSSSQPPMTFSAPSASGTSQGKGKRRAAVRS
jgi:hypothetical protein